MLIEATKKAGFLRVYQYPPRGNSLRVAALRLAPWGTLAGSYRWASAIVGEDTTDGLGMVHAGLILTGIALLRAYAEAVGEIRRKAEGIEGVFVAGFTDAAQRPKDYPEYLENVSKIPSEELRTTASASTATRRPSTS